MRALVEAARRGDRSLTIPAVVIAETWRGGRTTWLDRLLHASEIQLIDEALGRRAGELIARTGKAGAVDAIVAVSAAQRGDIVATSDPHDLQALVDDLPGIRIWPV